MWKQIKALRVLWPRRMSWRKTLLACTMIGLIVGAFAYGRFLATVSGAALTVATVVEWPFGDRDGVRGCSVAT